MAPLSSFPWRDVDDDIFVPYSAIRERHLLPGLRRSKRYFDTIKRVTNHICYLIKQYLKQKNSGGKMCSLIEKWCSFKETKTDMLTAFPRHQFANTLVTAHTLIAAFSRGFSSLTAQAIG